MDLQAQKPQGQTLEHQWWKTKRIADWTLAMAHAQSHAVAIVLAKICYCGLVFGGAESFVIWRHGLEGEHIVSHCKVFATYFAGKIDSIHSEMDDVLNLHNLYVMVLPSCSVLLDCF